MDKYELYTLLKGKVVNCETLEEATKFLAIVEKSGIKWYGGYPITYKSWDYYKGHTYYVIRVSNGTLYLYYGSITYATEQIITFSEFKNLIKNMETKEVKIQVPKGYEIDKENSTFECIKFKPKKEETYEDVARKLFLDKSGYYIAPNGDINFLTTFKENATDSTNCFTKAQAEKLLAINKLLNVATYLNKGWKPNFEDSSSAYYFYIHNHRINIGTTVIINYGAVYFKTEELAEKAIRILGEDTIRLALGNY